MLKQLVETDVKGFLPCAGQLLCLLVHDEYAFILFVCVWSGLLCPQCVCPLVNRYRLIRFPVVQCSIPLCVTKATRKEHSSWYTGCYSYTPAT